MTTLKQINADLKKLGYYVDEEDDNHFNLYKLKGKSPDTDEDELVCDVRFEIDQLPFCCGVNELGEFNISDIPHAKSDAKVKEATKLFVAYAFKLVKDSQQRSKGRIPNATGLILNSNGQGAWKFAEPVLDDILYNDFYCDSTTRNGAKGNVIKTYIAQF